MQAIFLKSHRYGTKCMRPIWCWCSLSHCGCL